MRRVCAAVCVLLSGAACERGSAPLPSAPSAVPVTAAAPQPARQAVAGYVYDTVLRPLGGVRVEVIQGPETGTEMISDADGRFSYEGTFATPVMLRATKDGYAELTDTVRIVPTGRAYANLQLALLAAPVRIADDYTLTIAAGSGCSTLPEEVRTRSYPVHVVQDRGGRPDTAFTGTVGAGQFAPFANIVWIRVAGNYVTVSTDGEGPSIVEQVGPNRYLAYAATAAATVSGSEVSNISAAFVGTIEYCELKAPVGQYYECRPELATIRERCTSADNQLTLSR
jgi:hypothetical protein